MADNYYQAYGKLLAATTPSVPHSDSECSDLYDLQMAAYNLYCLCKLLQDNYWQEKKLAEKNKEIAAALDKPEASQE